MIIVRVELKSAITGQVAELARAHICNIGGTDGLGDYEVMTLRGRNTQLLDQRITQRKGNVRGHPRKAQHIWNLVAKALAAMGYGK